MPAEPATAPNAAMAAATATPIIPCNDLEAATQWWARLGFVGDADRYEGYRILTDDDGASVHLTDAVPGWVVPGSNPFGVYLYTRRVDAIAGLMREFVLEPSRRPEHKPWGMYEFALNGPDDLLVRIGRPSAELD